MTAESIGRRAGRLWRESSISGKVIVACICVVAVIKCSGADEQPQVAKTPAIDLPPVPVRSDAEYSVNIINPKADAKRQFDALPVDARRNFMASILLAAVQDASPHLNHMDKRIQKVKGGYQILIVHDFFSKYTLSAGRVDGVFQNWMRTNESDLKKAGVVRVGVWGAGQYATGAYFDLK